jgi:hypothetical protein
VCDDAKEQKYIHLNSIGVATKLKSIVAAALHRFPNIAIATPQSITVVPKERSIIIYLHFKNMNTKNEFYCTKHKNSCT